MASLASLSIAGALDSARHGPGDHHARDMAAVVHGPAHVGRRLGDFPCQARRLADERSERVRGKDVVEREEHIHLMLARAFSLAGENNLAREALARAREVVDDRLEQIRDETLRETYLGAPHVRTIREGSLPA